MADATRPADLTGPKAVSISPTANSLPVRSTLCQDWSAERHGAAMCTPAFSGARFLFPLRGADQPAPKTMTTTLEKSFPVGKYLVSPLTRRTETGLYAASVSIRRGAHDRVLRFDSRFATRLGAQQFAIAEGLSWLHEQQLV